MCSAPVFALDSTKLSRLLNTRKETLMPIANITLSYAVTGISKVHCSAVIGTVQAQIAPPTACAVNVAPRERRKRFLLKTLAIIGIVQNRE